jgi:hypothetical protein
MAFATFSILSSVASAAAERPALVERYLFELCPKVVAGEIDLRDSGQLAAQGLAARSGPGGWTWAYAGRKQHRISVAFRDFSGKRVCKVGFGGRDNRALLRSVVKAGEARGWSAGGGAAELGGLVSFLYPPDPSAPKIMFTHWDEFDGLKPATNAALILDTER